MSYEVYRIIFYAGIALSAVCLAITILLLFLLKIPTVIGDLTGANARKSIEQMRYRNEATGEKTYKSSAVNLERGNLTDRIMQDGTVAKHSHGQGGAMSTSKIGPDAHYGHGNVKFTEKTEVLTGNEPSAETTVLYGSDHAAGSAGSVENESMAETTILVANEGSNDAREMPRPTQGSSPETTILSGNETTILTPEQLYPNGKAPKAYPFEIAYEIMLINTSERIA